MTCDQAQEAMQSLIDNDRLPLASEFHAVSSHLSQCSKCLAMARSHRALLERNDTAAERAATQLAADAFREHAHASRSVDAEIP